MRYSKNKLPEIPKNLILKTSFYKLNHKERSSVIIEQAKKNFKE